MLSQFNSRCIFWQFDLSDLIFFFNLSIVYLQIILLPSLFDWLSFCPPFCHQASHEPRQQIICCFFYRLYITAFTAATMTTSIKLKITVVDGHSNRILNIQHMSKELTVSRIRFILDRFFGDSLDCKDWSVLINVNIKRNELQQSISV